MYQDITIIGNAGQDGEMRYTPTGKAVTSFSVAVNERYGDKDTTTWFRVTCWEKLAEIASQYVTKGKLVLVKGTVAGRAYKNNQGEAAMTLEITCQTLKLLGGSKSTEQGAPAPAGTEVRDESDIPF